MIRRTLAVLTLVATLSACGAVAGTPAPAVAVCTTYEVAIADASHARGYDIRLACDDMESLAG